MNPGGWIRRERIAGAAVAIGLLTLWVRPPGTVLAAVMAAVVGAMGLVVPLPESQARNGRVARWSAVVLIGIVSFALARALVPLIPAPFTVSAVIANTVVAIGEEAFFRRLMYGWLETRGIPVAVAGSAVAFAAIHLPTYGLAAMPIDLAAGLLFSWQRWAATTWTAAAVTHAVANLLQLG